MEPRAPHALMLDPATLENRRFLSKAALVSLISAGRLRSSLHAHEGVGRVGVTEAPAGFEESVDRAPRTSGRGRHKRPQRLQRV
jgi:hypothetical protein